jgi:hypothetical protein
MAEAACPSHHNMCLRWSKQLEQVGSCQHENKTLEDEHLEDEAAVEEELAHVQQAIERLR